MESLKELGWAESRQVELLDHETGVPGRIICEQRESYRVSTLHGDEWAVVSGAVRHRAASRLEMPAVGDWAVVERPTGAASTTVIRALLPRTSALVRKVAGGAVEPQVIAANVDTVFIVTACTNDFNPRRLERSVTMVWESGAQPVVLINKSDLHGAPHELVADIERLLPHVPAYAVSALSGDGLQSVVASKYLEPAQTIVLLGSSGVGKSSLVNRLLGGEVQRVGEVRVGDAKGRHTTTHRELVRLPGGALIIDTPGMRELALWEDSGGALDASFEDVETLAQSCRFHDCRHDSEPGCSVRAAIDRGELDDGRLESYRKLERELLHMTRKHDHQLRLKEKKRWKMLTKAMRNRPDR